MQPEHIKKIIKRTNRWKVNWGSGSLKNTIKEYVGNNPLINGTFSGKIWYTNSRKGIRVVQDYHNNYYRVRDINSNNIDFSYFNKDGVNPAARYSKYTKDQIKVLLRSGEISEAFYDNYQKTTHFIIKE